MSKYVKKNVRPGYESKYSEWYRDELVAYAKERVESGVYPTFAGYCARVKIAQFTMRDWADRHPEFGEVYEEVKAIAEDMLVSGALGGKYNAQFAQFIAKNYHQMDDRYKTTVDGDVGVTIKFVDEDAGEAAVEDAGEDD